jgi:hypothetical protein
MKKIFLNNYVILLLGLALSVIMFLEFFSSFQEDLAFLLYFPLNINLYLQKYLAFRQNMYNKFCIFILNKNNILSSLIYYYHKILFMVSYKLEDFANFLSQYVTFPFIALALSITVSRLHFVEAMFFIIILILRINSSAIMVDRFYRQYPNYLTNHIIGPNINKRHMKKVIQPILENPEAAKTVAVAVVGALAWKMMDIHDTYKNADIAAADREAAERTANADREAAERTANADREEARLSREQAERHHQDEMAKAAADREEARLSREQADRHHQEEMARGQKE